MRQYISHFKYTLAHKWYVFEECCKRGIPLQGLLHDLSKFTPIEFAAYANNFFEEDGSRREGRPFESSIRDAFAMAWNHHQSSNPHHPTYWAKPSIKKDGTVEIEYVRMPRKFVLEMVSDWIGAGKAQGTADEYEWYVSHRDRIVMHPHTKREVDYYMEYDSWLEDVPPERRCVILDAFMEGKPFVIEDANRFLIGMPDGTVHVERKTGAVKHGEVPPMALRDQAIKKYIPTLQIGKSHGMDFDDRTPLYTNGSTFGVYPEYAWADTNTECKIRGCGHIKSNSENPTCRRKNWRRDQLKKLKETTEKTH